MSGTSSEASSIVQSLEITRPWTACVKLCTRTVSNARYQTLLIVILERAVLDLVIFFSVLMLKTCSLTITGFGLLLFE